MLRRVPTRLWQLRMMVVHIEPPLLQILVGVDKLVRQVLRGGVFTHMHSSTVDYSWVIRAGLGFNRKNIQNNT
jgi:hypothetical protein